MSASPVARQAASHVQEKEVPSPMKTESLGQIKSLPRKIVVNSPSELPHNYCSTPGGTLFSTTPGGTRIIYERNFLLNLRNSPLAKSPLKNLPIIPGVTTKGEIQEKENSSIPEEPEEKPDDQEQFAMDL